MTWWGLALQRMTVVDPAIVSRMEAMVSSQKADEIQALDAVTRLHQRALAA